MLGIPSGFLKYLDLPQEVEAIGAPPRFDAAQCDATMCIESIFHTTISPNSPVHHLHGRLSKRKRFKQLCTQPSWNSEKESSTFWMYEPDALKNKKSDRIASHFIADALKLLLNSSKLISNVLMASQTMKQEMVRRHPFTKATAKGRSSPWWQHTKVRQKKSDHSANGTHSNRSLRYMILHVLGICEFFYYDTSPLRFGFCYFA